MAEIKIPVHIDGVKSIEELANRVLDDYEYKGKTIREWADRLGHPKTRGDKIRAMSDEELAKMFLTHDEQICRHCPSDEHAEKCNADFGKLFVGCDACWLDWLKEEATSG